MMFLYNVVIWVSGFLIGISFGIMFLLLSIFVSLYKEEIQDAIREQTEAIQARIRKLRRNGESKEEESREEQSPKDDGDRWTRPQGRW
jgi:MFS superfamily sulfate permease-like transporter